KERQLSVRNNISKELIMKKILTLPGPFCSTRRVYNSSSSNSRPSPRLIQGCLREYYLKKVQRSLCFYKALPFSLNTTLEHHLGGLNPPLVCYKRNVLNKDDLLASTERNKMLHNHPLEKELREYL
ncbi:unnamed protein product, partial [Porites lobata]